MNYDLSGVIDLHVHTYPDIQPRLLDDIQAVEAAKSACMRALLIKSHEVLTADRATIAEKVVGGIRVFGGLVLNQSVGGFNIHAVETAIQLGAKIVWMPTHNAQNMSYWTGNKGGLSVLDDAGAVLPEVYEILDLIHQANIAIATGHLSIEESVALVRLAKSMGMQKIIVTHPESTLIRMPVDIQQQLCGPGVFFERCFIDTIPTSNPGTTIEEISNHIRITGVDSTFLSTDLGQPQNPPPVEGMSVYLASLYEFGFSVGEITQMTSQIPAFLMDL